MLCLTAHGREGRLRSLSESVLGSRFVTQHDEILTKRRIHSAGTHTITTWAREQERERNDSLMTQGGHQPGLTRTVLDRAGGTLIVLNGRANDSRSALPRPLSTMGVPPCVRQRFPDAHFSQSSTRWFARWFALHDERQGNGTDVIGNLICALVCAGCV
jgi:hypothetical protein